MDKVEQIAVKSIYPDVTVANLNKYPDEQEIVKNLPRRVGRLTLAISSSAVDTPFPPQRRMIFIT